MIASQYLKLVKKVDALVLRERVLVLIAGIVVVFFVTDSLAFQPIYQKQQVLLQGIQDQEVQLEILRVQSNQLREDNTLEQSSPLTQLQQELGDSRQELESRLNAMLSPDKAASVLEQILLKEKGLALNRVNTKQATLTSIDEASGDIVVIDDIKRYELKLQLEGGYLETLRYLQALEALQWKFFWERISFSVTDHPIASIDVEIYTLGSAGN